MRSPHRSQGPGASEGACPHVLCGSARPIYWTAGTQAARDKEVPAPLTAHVHGHFHPQGAPTAPPGRAGSGRSLRQGLLTVHGEEPRGGEPAPGTAASSPGQALRQEPLGLAREDSAPAEDYGAAFARTRCYQTQRGAWTRGPMTAARLRHLEQMQGHIQLWPCWPRPRSRHSLWSPGCWLSPAHPSVLGTRTGRGLTSALPAVTASTHKPPCAHALTLMCL